MLKKNLVRTGFLGHGLLVLLPNATALKGEPVAYLHEVRSQGLLHRTGERTDSLIAPLPDSVSTFSNGRLANALAAVPEIRLNRNAFQFVQSFMRKEEEALSHARARSRNYFRLIDTVFTQYGLPVELKYLAVVESDLKTNAVSRVGARGMWQLMPTTARELGLKVTRKYDERTTVYKSTVAAAKYLRSLYAEFGDWLLVMAAYNAGPGTVCHAIHRSGSKNFWVLQRYLPMESRGHVKRFIGTHYYFEGKGSMATLTRAETLAYNQKKESLNASLEKEKQRTKTSMSDVAAIK